MSASAKNPDIQAIISQAIRAPSGDNSQPWSFSWDGEALTICHDFVRAKHRLNHLGSASLISLGALVENICIAASRQKLKAHFELEKNFDLTARVWAKVYFFPDSRVSPDPLFEYIVTRRCVRAPYLPEKFPTNELEGFTSALSGYNGVVAHFSTVCSEDLLRYLVQSETTLWQWPGVVADTFKWVRLTRSEYEKRCDGLYWKELGVKAHEIPSVLFLKTFPSFALPAYRLGIKHLVADVARRNFKATPAFFLLTLPRADLGKPLQDSFIDIGRATQRLWLNVTQHGLVMQPITFASLFVWLHERRSLPESFPDSQKKVLSQGASTLASTFGFSSHERLPAWMFRLGRPLTPCPPTLRRPVDVVFKDSSC